MFRADGGCRHIVAAMYELENFVQEPPSVTDGPCAWKQKSRPTDEPCLARDLNFSSR